MRLPLVVERDELAEHAAARPPRDEVREDERPDREERREEEAAAEEDGGLRVAAPLQLEELAAREVRRHEREEAGEQQQVRPPQRAISHTGMGAALAGGGGRHTQWSGSGSGGRMWAVGQPRPLTLKSVSDASKARHMYSTDGQKTPS